MKFYGKTDVGVSRTENQDCFGIYEIIPGVTLLAVCDGMGGMAGGAVASRLALDTFVQSMREHIIPDNPEDEPDLGSVGLRFSLSASASEANRAVWQEAEDSRGKLEGMGTTLVALLVVENTLIYSLNIGDSRLYEITADKIEQITKDHSYVQHLLDLGKITYEEAQTSPVRNIITRAVGIEDDVVADIKSLNPAPGTPSAPRWLLLCSDGLSGVVSDEEIAELVREGETLQKKTESLVAAARAAGGPDNITVVLAEL
ncbi:MAG: Stp1/IreP family PP2C-type Ser/Thr phosphatase [Clostridia bacterium]|nr:Stp1/IreP family PP2C-type Ser/Thr phosphatase [Clostridia bacterium]